MFDDFSRSIKFWVMTSKPTLVRRHWLKLMQGPSVWMSSSDGVKMASNSSILFVPVIWIPASRDLVPLFLLHYLNSFFFQIESISLKCPSCNHSFTVKFNGDDVTGNESSETIFQLTTLTLCSSFIKNGDYVLTIFHYLYAWFTRPTPSIIMKFKANILIQFN